MSIQRFDNTGNFSLLPSETGGWVTHHDHQAELARAKADLGANEQIRMMQCDAIRLAEWEMDALRAALSDWLTFASDVQPSDAAGTDWLDGLRNRTKALSSAAGA